MSCIFTNRRVNPRSIIEIGDYKFDQDEPGYTTTVLTKFALKGHLLPDDAQPVFCAICEEIPVYYKVTRDRYVPNSSTKYICKNCFDLLNKEPL